MATTAASLAAGGAAPVGVFQLVNQAAQAIQALPAGGNDSVPSLAGDIAAAQQHAGQWTSSLGPQVQGVVQSTVGFGSTFTDSMTQLQALASRIASGDQTAISPFQAQLTSLEDSVNGLHSQVGGTLTALSGLSSNLAADQRALSNDQTTAQNALNAVNATMLQTQRELAKVSQELDQERSASGIALRILEDIFSLGLAELANNQSQLESEQNQLQQQLNSLQSAWSNLQNAEHQANVFGGSVGSLQTSMNAFSTQWDVFAGDFKEVQTNVNVNSAFLVPALNALTANWNDLLTQAKTLLSE